VRRRNDNTFRHAQQMRAGHESDHQEGKHPMDDPRPQDGALRQLENDPASRKRFLKMVGAGGAGALALLVAACGSDDNKGSNTGSNAGSGGSTSSSSSTSTSGTDQFGKGDVGIAKYALTLEYLEADFYKQAAASGMLKGQALELGKEFGSQEQQHVDALEAMLKKLGQTLPDKPKGKFPLDSQMSILKLAATVENLGAAAYLGQADKIKDPEVLAAALSIHSVEARHASALNSALGMPATPDGGFAKPASAAEVLKAVKPYIAS
jgi:rubrerythrin